MQELTSFTVISSEASLTHTLTSDRVTAHRAVLALALIDAPLAPVTRFTCYEGQQVLPLRLSKYLNRNEVLYNYLIFYIYMY